MRITRARSIEQVMGDIFINYPREDHQAAERLAEALKSNGWSGVVGSGYPAGRVFLMLMLVRWGPLVTTRMD
jgi:hypothetical protein